jgi:hypothetical protein
MANLATLGINLNDVTPQEERGEYTAIPAGVYNALVLEVDLRTTKAGTGQYLSCKFQILDTPYDRRYVWSNLNVNNPSVKATQIGRAMLKELGQSAGIENIQDTDELIDKQVQLVLAIDKDDATRNQVKAYVVPDAVKHAPTVAIPQPAANTGTPVPVWKK